MRCEVVCLCSAYWFPHRLGGVRCNGTYWAESYHELHSNLECSNCNCNSGSECDVANGAEDIEYCEAYQSQLRQDTGLRLPMDEDELLQSYDNR